MAPHFIIASAYPQQWVACFPAYWVIFDYEITFVSNLANKNLKGQNTGILASIGCQSALPQGTN